MKNILFCFTFLASVLSLTGQSNEWVELLNKEIGLENAKGFRIWIADVNNDNYPDLLWGGDVGGTRNHIYLYLNVENPDKNSPHKRIFVEYSVESGVQTSRVGNDSRIADIAALADVNNDGNIDLITSFYGHRLQNYPNNDPGDRTEVLFGDGNGNFSLVDNNGLTDMQIVNNLPAGYTNATGLSFLDYDLDGNIDLYMGTWFTAYDPANGIGVYMPNVLFKGNGDGTFSYQGEVGDPEPLYGTNICDWNNDGWPDIINSPYCRTRGTLYKNVNGTFVNATAESNYNAQRMAGDHGQALCQWEANPYDYDNDGDMDLLEVKVHGGYDANEGRTTISENTGAENGFRFEWRLDAIRRVAPTNSHLGDQGAAWFDLDNDGLVDMAIGQMAYPQANIFGQERVYVLKQDENGIFNDISQDIGIFFNLKEGHTMQAADYDLDGDLDLFVAHQVRDTIVNDEGTVSYNTYMQISLLKNNIGSNNNWTGIKLTPPADANASGIGARIKVFTQDAIYMQEVQAGIGHFAGMQGLIKNFGLKHQSTIDSITVRWPNKNLDITTIINPPVNTFLEISTDGIANNNLNKTKESIIVASESNLDFERVDVGNQKTKKIRITNLEDKSINIFSIDIFGDDVFILDGQYNNVTLNKGDDIEIELEFNPNIRLQYTSEIVIKSDADNLDELVIPVTGLGYEDKPVIAPNDRFILFENVWIDSTQSQKYKLKNIGEEVLVVDDISFNENNDIFQVDKSVLPFSLNEGNEIELNVSFIPNQKGVFDNKMILSSNAYNDTMNIVSLQGICNGPNPLIKTSIGFILNFRDVPLNETKEIVFDIINDGEFQLEIQNIEFVPDEKVYNIKDAQYPMIVNMEDKREVTISFTPKEDKSYTSEMFIHSDADNNPSLKENILGRGVVIGNVELFIDGVAAYKIDINPNPAISSARLTLETLNNNFDYLTIELFDYQGKKVMQLLNNKLISNNDSIEFDCSNLQSGSYFINIRSNKGAMKVIPLKIIK